MTYIVLKLKVLHALRINDQHSRGDGYSIGKGHCYGLRILPTPSCNLLDGLRLDCRLMHRLSLLDAQKRKMVAHKKGGHWPPSYYKCAQFAAT